MEKKNYNCFSYNQMNYLVKNGLLPVHVMIHSETKNTFWIFESSELLQALLKKWSIEKPKYRQPIV